MIPDWRDAAAYPSPDTPPVLMAWEFLRRNPAYAADWRRVDGLKTSEGTDLTRDDWLRLQFDAAHRWGLIHLADPAASIIAPPFEHTATSVHFAGRGARYLRFPEIKFDLAIPIDPQVDAAVDFLRRAAARWRLTNPGRARAPVRAGKSDRDEFVEMLRILDGDFDGAPASALISALWPRQVNDTGLLTKKLINRRRSAHDYRDRKYLELATVASSLSTGKNNGTA